MKKEERDEQVSRASRYDEIQSRLDLLKTLRALVDPNSTFDLEIDDYFVVACHLGDEVVRQIRTDLVDSLDRQIEQLEKDQATI